ncbi:hypothetical protein FUAX_16520 [Fulvitalea axinellae]|uniref:Uncharacterized protein n=1 Tax=Fulvitalea axinellae TaxID=1182444 RepID=A0AAU9DE77_9BACT|nr:hypothetical protein FUAX_16520 [Fulvitalea axinellae]
MAICSNKDASSVIEETVPERFSGALVREKGNWQVFGGFNDSWQYKTYI